MNGKTLLLDTHAVLWFWWDDPPRLSITAKTLICDPNNRKLVSIATPWEVAVKVSRKKLDIGGPYRGFFDQHMIRTFFEWLHIATKHLDLVAELPSITTTRSTGSSRGEILRRRPSSPTTLSSMPMA